MNFQKKYKNFSFGAAEDIHKGLSNNGKYRDILIDADTIACGENSAYKGIGCISANNSSQLLLDYRKKYPEIYHEILRLLFEKGYGAQLSHIKIELGADVNSSSGTEPCTMRSEDETADVTRRAGFVFAADAQKINPNITVDMLRWGQPAWVAKAFEKSKADGFKARYKWYSQTLAQAYNKLGLRFTHISPDANETGYADSEWIIYFSERIRNDRSLPYSCRNIKIVASDEVDTRTIAEEMLKNQQLRNAVDIIGLHYTTYGNEATERLYSEYGKEIWYSEGISPMNTPEFTAKSGIGGLGGRNGAVDMANRIINSWFHGKMTMYELQPAVSAYYDGSCYYPKHIICANEPWSGHYLISSGFYAVMHFTAFCKNGWHPVESACFGDGEENHYIEYTTSNYITFMPESRSDFSSVLTNDSSRTRKYRLAFKNCDLNGRKINIIESCGPNPGDMGEVNRLKICETVCIENDELYLSVKPYSIVTVTSLDTDIMEKLSEYGRINNKRSRLKLPHIDDFVPEAPHYLTDQGGAFEIVNEENKYYLEQKITADIIPDNWRFRGTPEPITCLGDDSWADYSAEVIVRIKGGYAGIGVRYNSAVACEITSNCGFSLRLFKDGCWRILFMDDIVGDGMLNDFDPDAEHKLTVTAVGNIYLAYIDESLVGNYAEKSVMQPNGRVSLTSSYDNNRFSELSVKPIDNTNSYTNKADALHGKMKYIGNPTLDAGASYKFSNRACAHLKAGDGIKIAFMGSAFALCGTVEKAKIKITLDGVKIEDNREVGGSSFRQAFYRSVDSKCAVHCLKVEVAEGELELDSVITYSSSDEYHGFGRVVSKKINKTYTAVKAAATTAAVLGTTAFLVRKLKKEKKHHN